MQHGGGAETWASADHSQDGVMISVFHFRKTKSISVAMNWESYDDRSAINESILKQPRTSGYFYTLTGVEL
jgi:hypothetical protein